jgi:heme-degrading monooxygenase HmoA
VTSGRARPGGEAALIAAAVRSFQAAGDAADAPPRLFQGYDDPERFYWVTRWASQELYLAGVPAGVADEWLDEVCADTLERAFFTPLDVPDREPAGMVWGGALVALGAGSCDARLAGQQLRERLRADPSRPTVGLYQGLDDASRYLALLGWESEAARRQFYAESWPRYEASIREQGGRVEPFVERTLADVDGYPRDPAAARPPIRAGLVPTD